MFLEQLILSAILCAAWSRKTQFGYKLNVYGAVGIVSIHSPDYGLGKYVHDQNPQSFLKCHLSAINMFVIVRMIEFSASITRACTL